MQLATLAHVGAAPPSEGSPDDAPLEVVLPLDDAPLEVVLPLDDAPPEVVPLDDAPLEVVLPLDDAPVDPPPGAPEEELAPEELEAPLPDDVPPQEELQLCSAHWIKPLQVELVQLEATMHVLSADEQLLLTHVLHVSLSVMPVTTEIRPSGSLHPPAKLLDPPLFPEVAPLQPVASSRSREPTTINMATRIFEFMARRSSSQKWCAIPPLKDANAASPVDPGGHVKPTALHGSCGPSTRGESIGPSFR
jgi:hypothetical protein